MTVAELKKILNDVPEDSTITVEYYNSAIGCCERAIVENVRDDTAYIGIGRTFSRVLAIKAKKESI